MIIELDTNLLKIVDNISINQLVLLSLVLDNNQKSYQSIAPIIRLVSDNEIQDLIDRNLIQKKIIKDKISYSPTKDLIEKITPKNVLFDQFYMIYPTMVIRPDGTKGFLRSNVKKCREYYNKLVKGNLDLHNRLISALNYEISDKTLTGKLGYMKTMWKWLTSHEWELIEEQMNEKIEVNTYGTQLR